MHPSQKEIQELYLMKKKGILLCYHGTKDKNGFQDTKKLTNIFKKKNKNFIIKAGYLENTKPSITTQIDFFLKNGIDKLKIVPVMIFTGGHVSRDIPLIIKKSKMKYNSNSEIIILSSLFKLNDFFKIVKNNVSKVIKKKTNNSLLLTISSNTSNKVAIKQMNSITKKTALAFKFKHYSNIMIGSNKKLFIQKLRILQDKGHRKIFVLPVFLFRGILLNTCLSVIKKMMTYNKTKYFIINHLNSYKIISNMITKSIKF